MKRIILIFGGVFVLCCMLFGAGTWKYMNYDPNITFGFENNVRLPLTNTPEASKDNSIAKFKRGEYEMTAIPYDYTIYGTQILGGLIVGTSQHTWTEKTTLRIERYFEPSQKVQNWLKNRGLGERISSTKFFEGGRTVNVDRNFLFYAKVVVDTTKWESLTTQERTRYNCRQGEEVVSTYYYFGDGYNGVPQCSNFIFGSIVQATPEIIIPITGEPEPEPVVIPEPEPVVIPEPEPVVIPEPEPGKTSVCRPRYEVWLWKSHSEDHGLEAPADSLYDAINGISFTNIQRSEDKIFGHIPFTFIGGAGARLRFSQKAGIASELYGENQENILAGKWNFQLEKYFLGTDSEFRIFLGPELRLKQSRIFQKNVLSIVNNPNYQIQNIEYVSKSLTTTESGLQTGVYLNWNEEKYNFVSLYLSQMFRENREEFKTGTSEISTVARWQGKFIIPNAYLFGAYNWWYFPKNEEADSLFARSQLYNCAEIKVGFKPKPESPLVIFWRGRLIDKIYGDILTNRQDIDKYHYERQDLSLGIFLNPLFGSRNWWLEAIVGHSAVKETYARYQYLNKEDPNFMEFKLTIGFSYQGGMK